MVRGFLQCLATGLAASLFLQPAALAHEEAVGLTEVNVKSVDGASCRVQSCALEVAHRLSIHDAESTLMSVLGARADLVGDPAAQEKFATYVADRFGLSDGVTGDTISLTLLGGEVERGYYWVYQEGNLPIDTEIVSITQGVLMDAIPSQTNRVNIKLDGQVSTLVFSGTPGPQSISLP